MGHIEDSPLSLADRPRRRCPHRRTDRMSHGTLDLLDRTRCRSSNGLSQQSHEQTLPLNDRTSVSATTTWSRTWLLDYVTRKLEHSFLRDGITQRVASSRAETNGLQGLEPAFLIEST
jgi:hypothetical protein